MTRLTATLAAVLLVGSAATAWAQNFATGPYIGLRAGVTSLEDQSEVGNTGNPLNLNQTNDLGFGVLGAAGYSFGWWRVEGEVGFRRITASGLGVNNDGGIPAAQARPGQTGTSQSDRSRSDATSAMGNLIIDVPWNFAGISPYVGVGLGFAHVNEIRQSGGGVRYLDDGDNRFAYQAIAGLSYNFNPHWSLSLDYRYFATTDPALRDTLDRPVSGEFKTHNGFLGVNYHFGVPKAPPPAPIPAAAPPPPSPPPPVAARPQPYLVFFDFDRSDITVEADRIIRQAADAFKKGQSPQMSVTGHTDRAGSDAYNQALSVRRANAVKARLVQYGVPANAITTIGKGESEPLVPTADGVREPQNRRAEIVIRQ